MAITTESLKNLKHAQPGVALNPMGKAAGTRDRLSRRFLHVLASNFEKNGEQAIEDMRQKDVVRYVLCVAGLLPKEIELKNPLDNLTDDDLAAGIAFLQARLNAQSVSAGADQAQSPAPLN